MHDVMFRTLADPGVDDEGFLEGIVDSAVRGRLTRSLRAGTLRREWCWVAVDLTGRIRARQLWWAPAGIERPLGVDLLSTTNVGPAAQLLAHARSDLGVEDAWCEVTAPIEAARSAREARPDEVEVLNACDFVLEVARVKVEWAAGIAPAIEPGRLRFVAARELGDDALVPLFRAVGDGSLDHGMSSTRDEMGAEREARDRLAALRAYPGQPDWFGIALDLSGQPVGYVLACLMEEEIAVLGEIGVASSHRGRGYVNDLLARATRQLVSNGAERIVADTDVANHPMRAAFTTAGYCEIRWRDDYRWRHPPHRDA